MINLLAYLGNASTDHFTINSCTRFTSEKNPAYRLIHLKVQRLYNINNTSGTSMYIIISINHQVY